MRGVCSLKAFVPVVLIGVIILLFFAGALNQLHSKDLHLGSVTSPNCSFSVLRPYGDGLSFVFGVPAGRQFPESIFSGEVQVRRDGKTLLVLPFQRSDLFETNWLDSEGLDSFAIRVPESGEKTLRPGDELVVALELSHDPPPDLTLWLTYYFSGWDAIWESSAD